jgi:hypothetical protein
MDNYVSITLYLLQLCSGAYPDRGKSGSSHGQIFPT